MPALPKRLAAEVVGTFGFFFTGFTGIAAFVTQGGSTATNYQLLPGDRVYVEGGPWICLDNALAHVLAMLKGALGFTLLPRP